MFNLLLMIAFQTKLKVNFFFSFWKSWIKIYETKKEKNMQKKKKETKAGIDFKIDILFLSKIFLMYDVCMYFMQLSAIYKFSDLLPTRLNSFKQTQSVVSYTDKKQFFLFSLFNDYYWGDC